ncbi:MAG: META domain-containing protein [Hydrogenophaga sp.]
MSVFTTARTLVWAIAASVLSACTPLELVGSHWALQAMDGQPPIPHAVPTLSFLPDGRLAGMASCNRYFGQFTHQSEQLSVTLGGSTKMWCEGSGGDVMAQESRFMELLAQAHRVSTPDGQLWIHTPEAQASLRFVALKPSPEPR